MTIKAVFQKIVIVLLSLSFTHTLGAGEVAPVSKENLIINFGISSKNKAAVLNACKTLTGIFTQNSEIYGTGLFGNATCTYRGKRLTSEPAPAAAWRLSITPREKFVEVIVTRPAKGTKTKKVEEAYVRFFASKFNYQLLANPEFVALLSYGIADQLPFSIALPDSATQFTYAPPKSKWPLPPPPKELSVFNLGVRNNGLFISRYLGRASSTEAGQWKIQWQSPGSGKPTVSMWAQNANGRGEQALKIQKVILQASAELAKINIKGLDLDALAARDTTSFADNLLSTLGSSYIGVRYGIPVATKTLLFGKASFFSLFVEMRSGSLSGLSYMFDWVPQVKDKDEDGNDLSLNSYRNLLSYSFNMKFKTLVNRMFLRPKLGIWSIEAKLPVTQEVTVETSGEESVEEEDIIFDYKMTNALSFGGQLGIEKNISSLMLRLWGGSDVAVGFLKGVSGSGTITSINFGSDLFIPGPKLTDTSSLSFLIFYHYENVNLKRDIEGLGETEFQYAQNYAGGGLSMAW